MEQGGSSPQNDDVLQFLDSLDGYLTTFDSLSSTLRQGWMDLASARHSMGVSRINGALVDLKPHSASTSLTLSQVVSPGNCLEKQPHFVLNKWDSSGDQNYGCEEKYLEDKFHGRFNGLQRRHCSGNQLLGQEGGGRGEEEEEEEEKGGEEKEKISANLAPLMVDDQVQKERLKTLSMFGPLVSPKLRAAQLSFETALDMLVDIANLRSAMLSSFDKVCKQLDENK